MLKRLSQPFIAGLADAHGHLRTSPDLSSIHRSKDECYNTAETPTGPKGCPLMVEVRLLGCSSALFTD